MPSQTETGKDKAPFPASALPPTRVSIVDCGLVAFVYVSIGLFYEHWKPFGLPPHAPTIPMLTGFLLGAGVTAWLIVRSVRHKDFLVMFYAGLLACWLLANISADMHNNGLPRSRVIIAALATFATGVFAFWNFVLVLRSADELQRRINYQALAFAYSGTLIVTLGYSLLEGSVLPHLGHLWVCGLMVVLWSVGLILSSRRYR